MVLSETIMKATVELTNIHHWESRRLSKWKINFGLRSIALFEISNLLGYYRNKQLPVSLSLTLIKVVSFWEGSYVFST